MLLIIVIIILIIVIKIISNQKYRKLESEVLQKLGFSSWNIISYFDEQVTVKSRQTLEKYNDVKFLRKIEKSLYEQRVLLIKRMILHQS